MLMEPERVLRNLKSRFAIHDSRQFCCFMTTTPTDLMQTVVMEPEMTLSILKDVAAGVNFLHHCEPPMVHQELQSSKVLLDSNCRALLSDVVSQPVSDPPRAASVSWLFIFLSNSNCWALC